MSNYNLAEEHFINFHKNNFIKKILFEIEKIFFLKKTKFIDEKKIFITDCLGPERLFTKFLYNTNSFKLNIFNMPLLLSLICQNF